MNVASKNQIDTTTKNSLFKNNLLEVKHQNVQIHYTNYDYWIAGILFFSFILFVWLFVSNRKRMGQIVKGFYINRYANQLMREEFSAGNRVSVFLSILFVFSISLFINQLIIYYHIVIHTDNLSFFFIAIAVIIALYAVKLTTIKMAGYILKLKKEATDYITTLFLFCNTTGLFMFPVIICLAFLKQISPLVFIYIGFGVLIGFISIRIIRGLIIGLNSSRVSKFYLFVYLCTLEILPILVVIKLLMLKINF